VSVGGAWQAERLQHDLDYRADELAAQRA